MAAAARKTPARAKTPAGYAELKEKNPLTASKATLANSTRIPIAANDNDFRQALKAVLVHEGGYVNNPKDPGGPTNKGVTQRVYNLYRKAEGKSAQAVKLITQAEVEDIYRDRYWDAIHGDELPTGVAYAVFDGAVNSGPVQSVKWLQRALLDEGLYSGKIDGLIGPSTLAAVRLDPNNDNLIVRMENRRLAFMRALKGWATFGKGWASRVAEVVKLGMSIASGADTHPPVSFIDGGQAKALLTDAKTRPSKAPGDALVGAGAAGGTGGTALSPYIDQLQKFSQFEFIARAVAVLILVSVLLAAAGFGYRWWQKRRERDRADRLDLREIPEAGRKPHPANDNAAIDDDLLDEAA